MICHTCILVLKGEIHSCLLEVTAYRKKNQKMCYTLVDQIMNQQLG